MRKLLFYILLPVIALIGVQNPFYGLCCYMAINILRPEMFFWGGDTGNILYDVTIGATIIGFFMRCQNLRSIYSYQEFWLLLWIWLATVATLLVVTSYPLEPKAWYYSNELFKLFVLGALLLGIVSRKDQIVRIQYVILSSITLLSLWGIDQHFRGNERLEGLGGSSFGDSNGVAAVGVLYLPIVLNQLLTAEGKKQKAIWLLSFLTILTMIVFTQSRGGMLGLIIGVAYLIFRTRKKKTLITLALLAVAIITFSPQISEKYFQRVENTATEEEMDYSAASRIVLWKVGLMIFKDHPIFGVGLLNFAKAKAPYKDVLFSTMEKGLLDYSFAEYKVGHGTFVAQIMPEGGLLLTIPYLWLIISFFTRSRRVRRIKKDSPDTTLLDLLAGLEAGVVGNLISIMFINSLFMYFLPLQILIGGQIIRELERNQHTVQS